MTLEAPGNRRLDARGRPRAALVAALAAAIFCGAPAAWSQNRASRGEKPKARAKPPVAWDKTTASAFFPDAFATLEGERPDFTALETGAAEASSPAAAPAAPTAGGFKWSALISADTLADEIKDMRGGAAKAVASLSDFKGGGFNDARQAFSSIALCFAVIDGYDGDARFKRDAKTARDLFARAGNNCKVGTQQSFNEAKARVADLETMLQGNSLEAQPGGGPGPAWSDVAARAALMGRLETADEAANAAVASRLSVTLRWVGMPRNSADVKVASVRRLPIR